MFVIADDTVYVVYFVPRERTEEEMEGGQADSAAGETKADKGGRGETAAISEGGEGDKRYTDTSW